MYIKRRTFTKFMYIRSDVPFVPFELILLKRDKNECYHVYQINHFSEWTFSLFMTIYSLFQGCPISSLYSAQRLCASQWMYELSASVINSWSFCLALSQTFIEKHKLAELSTAVTLGNSVAFGPFSQAMSNNIAHNKFELKILYLVFHWMPNIKVIECSSKMYSLVFQFYSPLLPKWLNFCFGFNQE